MFFEDLEGWNRSRGGRDTQEGGDICIHMVLHVVVQQKLTQLCKAVIFQ